MQTIGKYEVLDVIGYGGMGVVYRARDNSIGRLVALKVLNAATGQQPELRERFLREARSAGNLQHPNIVVIHDLGEHEGMPYIAMEFLNGQPLDKALQTAALSTAEKLQIFGQICAGLQFAHESGVVHRDVKPANVILLRDGKAKLVDFGIAHTSDARLTKTGTVIGTVAYMAPEQLKGKPVDARSDVFSAGAMLYEMLSGKLPFEGETTAETMMKILQEEPPDLRPQGVFHPAELAAIVQRALAKDPARRYQSARELGRAVREHLQEQSSAAAAATVVLGSRPAESRVESAPTSPAPAARPTYVPPTPPSPPPIGHMPAGTPPGRPVEGRRPIGGGTRPFIATALGLIVIFLGVLGWNAYQHKQAAHENPSTTLGTATTSPAPSPVAGGDGRRVQQLLAEAKQLRDSGKYAAAIATYNEVLRLDPNNAEATAGLKGAPAPPAAPASQADTCAGRPHCYSAGPFIAEVIGMTPSQTPGSLGNHVLQVNVRFRNLTNQPLILAYVAGSGVITDNNGKRYDERRSGFTSAARGIGAVDRDKADPQFVLSPGASSNASFVLARAHEANDPRDPIGTTFNFDLSIAQLEVLPNQQTRTLREYFMDFSNLTAGGAGKP